MMSNSAIYVIGHINPDTDTIASAVGYAWLLHQRDGVETIAARAGALNPQTGWVLKRLRLDPPILLTDASPRFESVSQRLDTLFPDSPLSEAWTLAARTGGLAPIITEDGKPYGLISGFSLFGYFIRALGPKPNLANANLSDVMSASCEAAADTTIPQYFANAFIRDAINRILRDEYDNYFVVNEQGLYHGIARQSDLLNPPRLKVILVDHNEPRQAIASLEEAELIEILDHHRLGNPYTHTPIRFSVDIVGSTSTLITERTIEAGLSLPPAIAGLLLAGVLSDTLLLKSPTTTIRDRQAVERLSRWAFSGGSPLKDETVESFGKALLSAGVGLTERDPYEIVNTDVKAYESAGFKFAIAQVEVTDLIFLTENLNALQTALNEMHERKNLDFAILLVTDVVRGSSRLLLSAGSPPVLDYLPYPVLADGTRDAVGVVSRKKQLLPVVLGLLEG
ncbi:MAG: DHHA2 domain-containing protein [Anaerolineales bacterium]